jgi:hypothetical protein
MEAKHGLLQEVHGVTFQRTAFIIGDSCFQDSSFVNVFDRHIFSSFLYNYSAEENGRKWPGKSIGSEYQGAESPYQLLLEMCKNTELRLLD